MHNVQYAWKEGNVHIQDYSENKTEEVNLRDLAVFCLLRPFLCRDYVYIHIGANGRIIHE
jgi:hypothetical protein